MRNPNPTWSKENQGMHCTSRVLTWLLPLRIYSPHARTWQLTQDVLFFSLHKARWQWTMNSKLKYYYYYNTLWEFKERKVHFYCFLNSNPLFFWVFSGGSKLNQRGLWVVLKLESRWWKQRTLHKVHTIPINAFGPLNIKPFQLSNYIIQTK